LADFIKNLSFFQLLTAWLRPLDKNLTVIEKKKILLTFAHFLKYL
jgi:hypothetical protein